MEAQPKVALIMGSKSDWDTVSAAHEVLDGFGVAHECRVLSAHRTPEALATYVRDAEQRGVKVFVGAAGGAAHLAGVIASLTLLPVLAIPIESPSLKGLDSLLSMVQMPAGIPVGTLAVGKAGATNAGLLAIQILGVSDAGLIEKLREYRRKQADKVLASRVP